MPTVAQLMKALPDVERRDESIPANVAEWAMRPVPVGRWRRMGVLGTLQAKIAAAYLFYWIRGWFKGAPDREAALAETHWRTAARVLDSMGYLRGAAMKVGQTLGSFPDIVPSEFVETLERLQFAAPPMHWSLMREMVHNELGRDVADVFEQFDERAFAAASIGQVHGARLKDGRAVAVKVQYPGIARTVTADFGNLGVFMLPARLTADWESVREQFDDVRALIESETDYEHEGRMLERSRQLFRDDDPIVVPRLHPQYSTARLLAMDRLGGVHLDRFLAAEPSQELRNEFGRHIVRGWYRLMFAGRLYYADCHPGNYLFMDDGRLGLIDFGGVFEIDDRLWDFFRRMDVPMTTGDRAGREAIIREWCALGEAPADADHLRVAEGYADWNWRPRYHGGPFDFGDETEFRRGIDLFTEMVRKRYSRGHRSSSVLSRQQFGLRAILYRLKAKFDVAPIAEEEVRATGWDRSGYAPAGRL